MKKTKKQLKNIDLDSISGGSTNLDDYLKKIDGKGKNDILVDHGSGVGLDINPSIQYEEDGNLHIIKREKNSPEIDADLYINSK